MQLNKPLDLSNNIFQNVLQGYKYIYHYSNNTLPSFEMNRWNGKGLQMSNVFNFDTKAMVGAGWDYSVGAISGPMYFGRFIDGTQLYLGNASEYINEIDPSIFSNYQKVNILAGSKSRRIGWIKFNNRAAYQNL